MALRYQHSLLRRPTCCNALTDDIIRYVLLSSPLSECLSDSVGCDVGVRLAVICLCLLRYPTTVVRGITPMIGHSIEGHALTVPMGECPSLECNETFVLPIVIDIGTAPFLTDLDSSRTILVIVLTTRIMTPATHPVPDIVEFLVGDFSQSRSLRSLFAFFFPINLTIARNTTVESV